MSSPIPPSWRVLRPPESATGRLGGERELRIDEALRLVGQGLSLLVMTIAGSALVGWAYDLGMLKSWMPGTVSMKGNTAGGLLLCGGALWMAFRGGRRAQRLAMIAFGIAGAMGMATVFEHLSGLDLGMDQWLFADIADAVDTSAPGRMSFNAAVLFPLVAAAVVAKTRATPNARRLSDSIALSAFGIALLALIGYAYQVHGLTRIAPYTSMAVNTALAFMLLSIGVMALQPVGPLVGTLVSRGPGGTIVRRLLPFYALLLVLTGALPMLGAGADIRGVRAGVVSLVTVSIVMFGVAVSWSASTIDRTDRQRQRAESARLDIERQFKALVEATFDGVVMSENGIIIDANIGLARMFGHAPGALVGQPLESLVAIESRQFVRERVAAGVEGAYEAVGVKDDGRRLQFEAVVRVISIQGREIRISAMRDITERRKLEAQLRQAVKMEAVGRLAGGVAHDFNNLLTVISASAQLLVQSESLGEAEREDLAQIMDAADSAAGLTRQLLAFSRQQTLQPQVVALEEVVVRMEKLVQRIIGGDVTVTTVLSPHSRLVRIDPTQVEQVIMNLAVNARDAMPRGGELRLGTEVIVLDADAAMSNGLAAAGEFVVMSVSDTGHGMDEETQRRIFEPFFTTKEQGRGTGLGLATVYGIVRQSGGFITVDSAPGRGTRFSVHFPVHGAGPGMPVCGGSGPAFDREHREVIGAVPVTDEGVHS